MNMQSSEAAKKSPVRKAIISVIAGGIAGFLAAFGFMQFVGDKSMLGDIGTSGEIAALVGLIYIVCALGVGFGVVNPKVGAKFLNVEDAEELREQRQMLGYSSIGLIAMGAVLVILALAGPAMPIAPMTALIVVVALVILTLFATSRQLRHSDELMTNVGRDTSSLSFYLTVLIGGGWAMLAHLGFTTGPAMLDWMTMFAGLVLVATFWVCGRRGMLTPR
ncbi:hypothetical protein [Altererythrobacter sp. ZODW24]|uniref:hypothetical protein n=1 Tax=Altererythrobacter sp. ZODW24 TaxID=2185142 RepID=UPI000DF7E4C9|nr:hypothetical protein [Altererythrobacter sp. ZODW24]